MADGNQLAQAYSILGQATTAEYNRRRREEEALEKRRMRQQMMSYVLAPIGQEIGKSVTSFISSPFEKKYEEFLENEPVTNIKRKQRAAQAAFNSQIDPLYRSLQTYNGTDTDWAIDNLGLLEAQKRTFAEELAKKGKDISMYKEDALNAILREQIRETGKGQAIVDSLRDVFEKGSTLSTEEEIMSFIKSKNKLPRTLGGALSNMVRGRSVEEIERGMIETIQKSERVKDTQEFNKFLAAFNTARDFTFAQESLETALNPAKKRDQVSISLISKTDGDGNLVFLRQTTTKPVMEIDKDGRQVVSKDEINTERTVIDLKDEETRNRELVKTLQQSFNLQRQGFSELNSRGQQIFQRWTKENGHSFVNPASIDSWSKQAEFISVLMKDPRYTDNTNEDIKKAIAKGLVERVAQTSAAAAALEAEYAAAGEDPSAPSVVDAGAALAQAVQELDFVFVGPELTDQDYEDFIKTYSSGI
jgi:hypothetical protein